MLRQWETYLALNKVTNAGLSHDGDGDRRHDLLDHLGIGHSRHASLYTDICWDTLESHDCTSSGLLCDSCLVIVGLVIEDSASIAGTVAHLFGIDHVHNDPSLQHTGQARLDGEGRLSIAIGGGGAIRWEIRCHVVKAEVEFFFYATRWGERVKGRRM